MPICFAATRQADDLTIDIFDVIGERWWGEGITAKSISQALIEHADAKTISVRINSPGGEVFEGTAIFNLLRQHSAKIRVQVIGLAASMASVVALAGDHVAIASNALIMIHNPWVLAIGDGEGMRKTAEWLDKIKATLLNVYEAKSGIERDRLSKMMDDETWMTAEEALAAGFVDEILPAVEPADDEPDAQVRAQAVIKNFERAPDGVLSRFSTKSAPLVAAMSADQAQHKPRSNKTMDREKIIALLELPADSTDAQVEEAIASAKAARALLASSNGGEPTSTAGGTPGIEVDGSTFATATSLHEAVPRSDYDALRDEVSRLRTEAEARAKREFDKAADAEIAAAVKAGKITPASRDYHKRTIVAGGWDALQSFREYVAVQPTLLDDRHMRGPEDRNNSGVSTADAKIRKICAQLQITPDEFKAAQADIRDNPETYAPEAYSYSI